MKKRTSVHLGRGVTAPLYFRVAGTVTGQYVRVAHVRDWSVFHIPDWSHPVAMAWNVPGHERVFATHNDSLQSHDEALANIEKWMHLDWVTHREEYGGVTLPLVTHEKFVIVPECADIEVSEGAMMIIEPPCLLWYEWQPHDGHDAAVAATILIR